MTSISVRNDLPGCRQQTGDNGIEFHKRCMEPSRTSWDSPSIARDYLRPTRIAMPKARRSETRILTYGPKQPQTLRKLNAAGWRVTVATQVLDSLHRRSKGPCPTMSGSHTSAELRAAMLGQTRGPPVLCLFDHLHRIGHWAPVQFIDRRQQTNLVRLRALSFFLSAVCGT